MADCIYFPTQNRLVFFVEVFLPPLELNCHNLCCLTCARKFIWFLFIKTITMSFDKISIRSSFSFFFQTLLFVFTLKFLGTSFYINKRGSVWPPIKEMSFLT